MVNRFFTGALALLSPPFLGTERFPFDYAAGDSGAATVNQLRDYILAAGQVPTDKYSADSSTTDFTATAGQVGGVPDTVVLDLTGVLAAGANLTLPTAAALGALAGAFVGQTWILRLINNSSGAFSWTVLVNTGLTLNGTVTVAQNTWREYLIRLTALNAAVVQNIGSGGN